MALEKQFANFLLDRIDENLKGMQGEGVNQIKLHLKELRTVVDTSIGGTRRGGGANA